MKVKANLTTLTLEYLDSKPYIQGEDSRNKLIVYVDAEVTLTNIQIAYQLQNGRNTIKLINDGIIADSVDTENADYLEGYNGFVFNAPLSVTNVAGNFVATVIFTISTNVYKINVLNTVLKAVDFENFENALEGEKADLIAFMNSTASSITIIEQDIRKVLATTSTMANDVVQNLTGLAAYPTDDLPDGFRVLVMNDENFDDNPVLYQYSWDTNTWQYKGNFDWTQYLDAKFDGYKETTDNYIDGRLDAQDETIAGLGQLRPSGVDTSTNILTFTEDKGIYIGSDTGYWYYWDGTQYVSGGIYQATQLNYKSVAFDKTTFVKYIHNYYNYETMTTNNKVLAYDNNSFTESNNSDFCYLIVPIESKGKYIISGTSYKGWLTNDNMDTNLKAFGDYSTPQTDVVIDNTSLGGTKLIINIRKSSFNIAEYMVLRDDEMSDTYISYNDDYYVFVKEKESPLIKISSSNLFDKNTMVGDIGKYVGVDGSNNFIINTNSAFSYFLIPVKYGETYIITGKSYQCYLTDRTMSRSYGAKGNYDNQKNFVFTNDDIRATHIIINVRNSNYPSNWFQMNQGNVILPYEKYFNSYYDLENKEREYYVSTTTALKFIDVIKYLENDTSKKTIYINSGIYDLFEEFGGSAYAQTITSDMTMAESNPIIPINTKVVGLGYVELRFTPTQEEIGETASIKLSPINIQGSVELENLTIIGDNCRYCIHDESGSNVEFTGSIKKYKNIHLKKTQSSGYGFQQAYGCGFDKDFYFEFDNCVFEGIIAFSMHNRGEGTNNIVIKNSAFISSGDNVSMRFGVDWTQHNLVYINNCYINNDVKIISETGIDNTSAYDITLINCNGNYQCTTDAHITNQYGFKDYK